MSKKGALRKPSSQEQQRESSTQDAIAEIADLLPGSTPVVERVRQVVQQTKYQGPLPHPEIFRLYGEVIPDAPERILQVFEKDSCHVRDIQTAALEA